MGLNITGNVTKTFILNYVSGFYKLILDHNVVLKGVSICGASPGGHLCSAWFQYDLFKREYLR